MICIEESAICDGFLDCPSATDEKCGLFACPQDEWLCPTDVNMCIYKSDVCDGLINCIGTHGLLSEDDISDETGCEHWNCTGRQLKCADNKQCVSVQRWCNKHADCADASDEINCTCSSLEFRCHDTSCIDELKHCDGKFDCSDYSDEMDCTCKTKYQNNPMVVCQNMDQCRDCIPAHWVCDGYSDCPNGTEELDCYKLGN